MYEPTRRRLLRDLTGAGVGAAGAGLLGRELVGEDEAAEAAAPSCTYNRRGGTRLRNRDDSIYRQAGGSGAILRLRRRKASTIRKGLIGTITVGID